MMIKQSLALVAFAAMALSCSTNQNVSSTTTQSTAKYTYNCVPTDNDGGFFSMSELNLTFRGNKVDVLDKDDDATATGDLNPNYKPTSGKWSDSVQYKNLEALSGESGSITMIANKSLLTGASKGLVQLRWSGESYDSKIFKCTVK